MNLLKKLFRRKNITGSSIITKAIASFEQTIAELERGIAMNVERINRIDEQKAALESEQLVLATTASRAENTAAKLRDLIA